MSLPLVMDSPDSVSSPDVQSLVQGLFIRHTDVIRGFIYGLLPDRVRTDDVLQETFLTVTRKAADFEPGTNFAKWACSIARYKVMEEQRAIRRSQRLLSPDVMEALAVTEEAYARDPRIDQLPDCLERLPEGMKRLLRLRYQEDHTPAEVAERVGWSSNAVYVGLSRARTLLRECLENGKLEAAN